MYFLERKCTAIYRSRSNYESFTNEFQYHIYIELELLISFSDILNHSKRKLWNVFELQEKNGLYDNHHFLMNSFTIRYFNLF